ncbi:MAG: phosphatase PAP2 family protein [Firmicutes bacterium]|nr:phosphatase PAP2 family protein [Bacillota bacterium]
MGHTFYFDFEPVLMEWVQNMLGTIGVQIASLFTMLGEELVIIAILGFLYWCYDKEFAKVIGTNIVVALVLNPLIKNIVIRRRPYFDHEGIKCLKAVDSDADIYDIAAQGYSFPSGHSTNSAVVYWSLLKRKYEGGFRALKPILIILPILIGLSRIAIGVHYPTDVLAGWALGGAIIILLNALGRMIEKRGTLHLAIFLISLVGVLYCRTSDYFTSLGVMAGFFLAIPFEERFVNFEPTRKPLLIVLRLVGGIAIYFALNTLLKLPFDAAFLASSVLPAFLIRSLRYTIILFIIVGIYPLAFGRIKIK